MIVNSMIIIENGFFNTLFLYIEEYWEKLVTISEKFNNSDEINEK